MKIPEPEPEEPSNAKHSWANALLRCVFERKATPLLNYIEVDWEVIKPVLQTATASCFTMALFLFIGGCWVRGKVDEAKINTLVSSNSFLAGQYQAQIKTAKTAEEKADKDERHFNGELTQAKLDAHEIARSKDVEISRLEAEKFSAQQRLSYFQSLPEHILNLVTNLSDQNDPTNRQQLATVIGLAVALTNSLNSLSLARPDFDLYLNQQKVTNGCSISLKLSRQLKIDVRNTGGETAEHLRILLKASGHLQKTNLIATQWRLDDLPSVNIDERNHRISDSDTRIWEWRADSIEEPRGLYGAETIEISTNFPHASESVVFEVFSARSALKQFMVELLF